MQIANNRQQLMATPPTHTSGCFAAASMSLLKYFKSSVGLLTAKQTGLTEKALSSDNTTVQSCHTHHSQHNLVKLCVERKLRWPFLKAGKPGSWLPFFCNFVSVIMVYMYLVWWYHGKFHILILHCNCILLLKTHLKEVVYSTLKYQVF